jgi:hypothetical protein
MQNPPMSGVFICYRREDAAPYAGRLYDFLRHAFPNNKVFIDIDTIDPGEDFVQAIDQTLAASRIVVAVIGPTWLTLTDSEGRRRLDNPDDYVVRELSAALASEARVIPVLVGGAAMPGTEALPARLQALGRRHALEVSDTRFIADAELLGEVISRVVDPAAPPARRRSFGLSTTSELADSFRIFKTLLWTGYSLGLLTAILQIQRVQDNELFRTLLLTVLVFGVSAWFNVMLLRGKNWARMAAIALFALAIPALLSYGIEDQSWTQISLEGVSVLLNLWLFRLMFTDPIRRLFMSNV